MVEAEGSLLALSNSSTSDRIRSGWTIRQTILRSTMGDEWQQLLESPIEETYDPSWPQCKKGHGPMRKRTRSKRVKGWSWDCRECARLDQKRRRLAGLGITLEDYERLLEEQGGVCAICKQPETQTRHGRIKELAVDHDHTTGLVRALLCHACNVAIGYLRDDPDLARSVANYLENHA